MKKWILPVALTASLVGLAACSNSGDEAVVETKVGNVTKEEFYDAMKDVAGSQVLQNLVYEKVLSDKYKITDEELDEEVIFVQDFLNKNKTQMNILPLAIDAEYHDGVGRADEMWDERAELLSNLILKFKEKGIDTIVYSNANTAAEYLDELDTKLWIAYYDKKGEIPNHWYSETDQEAALNEEFTNKIIAWQFTETGIDRNSKFQVDFSIVDNRFFKQFVR